MMHNMMSGMGTYPLFWIGIIVLLVLLLASICIGLLVNWLKNQRASLRHYTPQPQDSYQEYEQGYQPQQQPPETYQEGEHLYSYPQSQYEQPQVQNPQVMSSER